MWAFRNIDSESAVYKHSVYGMPGIICHAPFPAPAPLYPHVPSESHPASAKVPHPPAVPAVLESPGCRITWYKAGTETIKCGNVAGGGEGGEGEGGAFHTHMKIQSKYYREEKIILKFLALTSMGGWVFFMFNFKLHILKYTCKCFVWVCKLFGG